MDTYVIKEDIPVIGLHVTGFPAGIKEAFDTLADRFGTERDYFGLSWMNKAEGVEYYAMTRKDPTETISGDLAQLNIPQGRYRSEELRDWMSKTGQVREVFERLLAGLGSPAPGRPCVEWYLSDDQMLCLVKE